MLTLVNHGWSWLVNVNQCESWDLTRSDERCLLDFISWFCGWHGSAVGQSKRGDRSWEDHERRPAQDFPASGLLWHERVQCKWKVAPAPQTRKPSAFSTFPSLRRAHELRCCRTMRACFAWEVQEVHCMSLYTPWVILSHLEFMFDHLQSN